MPTTSRAEIGALAASLVEVSRGPIVESRHRGHLIAIDGAGKTVTTLGAPETVTYIRSSAKPFQAMPLVASGAADRFGFSEKEIAIACGSHSGEPEHVATVQSMLGKIGRDEGALKCGAHVPYSAEVARELVEKRQAPQVLQNNCSGKHAGMLALALHIGAPTETYDQPANPVQQQIAKTVSTFSDVPLEKLAIGVDGCGAPVFGLSVHAMALMYARLVKPPHEFDVSITKACGRIVNAMINFPEMVGGSKGRLDTELIRAGKGRLISKIGAEGVYTVGALPGDQWPNGLGFALKVEDGDDHRARPPAVIEALRQLGLLNENDLSALSEYSPTLIKNRRGDLVGEARAAFTLEINRHG
ncbi:MAG TPA: asparaginase [Pyrinomonadaceae bacterium]|nr:asparaginase [Pyrinomonadaceae bacterium]